MEKNSIVLHCYKVAMELDKRGEGDELIVATDLIVPALSIKSFTTADEAFMRFPT